MRLIGARASQFSQSRISALNQTTGAYGVFELNYDADKVCYLFFDEWRVIATDSLRKARQRVERRWEQPQGINIK